MGEQRRGPEEPGLAHSGAPSSSSSTRAAVAGIRSATPSPTPGNSRPRSSTPSDRLAAFAAATGQILWTAAPDGRLQDVAAWCAYTGEPEAQAREAGWLAAVHPEDRPRAAVAWRDALARRGSLECEVRVRRFDGAYGTFRVRAALLADAAGRMREWVGCCADISERVAREHDTEAALEALAQIAEVVVLPLHPATDFSASGAHLVVGRLADLTRRTLACAQVAIATFAHETQQPVSLAASGFAEGEAGQGQVETQVHLVGELLDTDALTVLRGGRELLVGEMPARLGARVLDQTLLLAPLAAGDDLLGVLAATYPLAHECAPSQRTVAVTVGKLIALVLERERLLRERAEARARALAMQQAKREMDEFLSIASHELKTPLTSIRGFIQLAEQRLRTLEDATVPQTAIVDADAERFQRVRVALERAEYQTGQMSRLINELLDASRVHASRLELQVARHDLAAMVREVVEEQRLNWPGRVIQLEEPGAQPAGPGFDVTTISVPMDVARVRQVLTNFLTNALKYSPAAQPVRVRLHVAAGHAHVAVSDAGPGIPPEEHVRIWERFYRSRHVPTQHGPEGLGLGLYISRAIVERHGGHVGLVSQVGRGATFTFMLPLDGPA